MHATKFNGIIDELGLSFSGRWARDGHGEWCYGKISFVYKKIGRQPQKYRILYHDGTSMPGLESDMERAPESDIASSSTDSDDRRIELEVDDREEDSPYSEEGTVDGSEEEDDDEEEVHGVRVRARRQSKRQAKCIQEESGNAELEDSDSDSDAEEIRVGGVTHQLGKRKRNKQPVKQNEGTDVQLGDTVQVGSMTWE